MQSNQDGESEEIQLWTPTGKDFDVLIGQVQDMAKAVNDLVDRIPQGQTQTVIHKTQGMGMVGVVCATVSIMCVLFLLLGAIIFVPDIHDLKAWQDINRKDIARLQAQQQQGVKP